jgi:rare lipoprotein A
VRRRSRTREILGLTAALLVAGCGPGAVRDGPPADRTGQIAGLPGDAVPRPEPRSRYGNGPVYEVFGKRYTVMNDGAGYKERGVASWYGKKFHGNLTAMREPYDMYAMTAAHKSLPLPSYVRVRNLRNDRSVVVRVNDRGPFVHNRIIDLSYAAALKLDMVRDGTSLVEVEVIGFDTSPGDVPTRLATPAPAEVPAPGEPPAAAPADENRIFVQVGAFSSRENADRRIALLRSGGIGTGFVHEDAAAAALYRVRIGPITGVEQYDLLVAELEKLGISDPYLVAE